MKSIRDISRKPQEETSPDWFLPSLAPCNFLFGHLHFDVCPECNEPTIKTRKGSRSFDDLINDDPNELLLIDALRATQRKGIQ